ncbi:universal stress protein [Catellatospora chokoriensis]|uniref:universal stress protein n=1 Tax=Catellatospora chokoriensis TaxID=310353 RepID=UPI001784DE7F|nr:universal stress protein [Catellatospora chokoriensis]
MARVGRGRVRFAVRSGQPPVRHVKSRPRPVWVVVGNRGHAGAVGVQLGSVSQALLDHACCPVAVVR